MAASLEIMLGQLIGQTEAIAKGMDKAEVSRKEMYIALEGIRDNIAELNNRVHVVEKQMSEAQPTIAQFITVKNQVKAAGIVGKYLWLIGGFLIGSAAWLKWGSAWLVTKLWGS